MVDRNFNVVGREQSEELPEPLKIVVVGRLPPPTGGVATSLASIRREVERVDGTDLHILPWHQLWKLFVLRPEVVHFNFSKPYKRLLATALAKAASAKVVHMVHGNNYNFRNLANYWTIRLSDGFILLNSDIYRRFSEYGASRIIQLSPIFASGERDAGELDAELEALLVSEKRKTIVVYANSKLILHGHDVYGYPFVAQLLTHLAERQCRVLFLDPSGAYATEELDNTGASRIIHFKRPVNFPALLRKVDLYIRPTSTDGNSVAVLEALAADVPVLASDSVPRPEGVMLYKYGDAVDFLEKIDLFISGSAVSASPNRRCHVSRASDYISFLRSL